jgi:hypothetical protein
MSSPIPSITLGTCRQGHHCVCDCGAVVLTCVCGAAHTRLTIPACGVCTAPGGLPVPAEETHHALD